MSDWRDIATAPKDGTVIVLTWMENGEPQEQWPMQWGHIMRNGFFPGKVGMWMTPDAAITWNEDCPPSIGGPTHWMPLPDPPVIK